MAKSGLAEQTALQVVGNTALAERPAYITRTSRGTEHIGQDDLQMPRLAIAQKMSHEVDENDAKYIPGLKVGDFFNTLTQEIYGRGPLTVAVVRADLPRAMELRSIDDGGGILDRNVPLNDPRLQWGPDGEKPVATLFRDFVVAILPRRELIAVSFKATGLKVAKQWNTYIKMRDADLFSGTYSLSTITQPSSKGPFFNYKVANAGWVDPDTLVFTEASYEGLKTRELVIDRQPGDDDSFTTDGM